KLKEELGQRSASETKRKKLRARIEENQQEAFDQLAELRINKKQIEKIVGKLKTHVVRVEKAEQEIGEIERRIGLSTRDLRKTQGEMKQSPQKARAIEKKLGLTAEELDAASEEIGNAKKKIKRVEDEAKLDVEDLRRTYKEIHEGER